MKPLKRIVCWIIGHNWLPSHYDMAHFRGGDGSVAAVGRLRQIESVRIVPTGRALMQAKAGSFANR